MELNPPAGREFGVPAPAAAGRGGRGGGRGGPGGFNRNDFFFAEGALGTLSTAPRGHGIYTISGNRNADPARVAARGRHSG